MRAMNSSCSRRSRRALKYACTIRPSTATAAPTNAANSLADHPNKTALAPPPYVPNLPTVTPTASASFNTCIPPAPLVDRLQSPPRPPLGLGVDPLPRRPVEIPQMTVHVLHREHALNAAVLQQEIGVSHPTRAVVQIHRLARHPLDIVVVRLDHGGVRLSVE